MPCLDATHHAFVGEYRLGHVHDFKLPIKCHGLDDRSGVGWGEKCGSQGTPLKRRYESLRRQARPPSRRAGLSPGEGLGGAGSILGQIGSRGLDNRMRLFQTHQEMDSLGSGADGPAGSPLGLDALRPQSPRPSKKESFQATSAGLPGPTSPVPYPGLRGSQAIGGKAHLGEEGISVALLPRRREAEVCRRRWGKAASSPGKAGC